MQHQLWWTQCPKLCSLPSGHLTFICASNSFFCFRSYAHVKVSRAVFVKIHSSFHFRIMVRGGAMATVVGGMTNASHLLIFQVFQLFFLHFYMMNLFLTYSIHPNRSGPSCSDETVCFDKEVDPIGAKYDGCVNTTVSGRTCQVSLASWGIFQLVVYF